MKLNIETVLMWPWPISRTRLYIFNYIIIMYAVMSDVVVSSHSGLWLFETGWNCFSIWLFFNVVIKP